VLLFLRLHFLFQNTAHFGLALFHCSAKNN
jgi:hypothetical protein